MKSSVIYGGTGFVGVFFARHLIEDHGYEKVYLYDLQSINDKEFDFRKNMVKAYPQIEIIIGDVKETINWTPIESIDLILPILQLFIVNQVIKTMSILNAIF